MKILYCQYNSIHLGFCFSGYKFNYFAESINLVSGSIDFFLLVFDGDIMFVYISVFKFNERAVIEMSFAMLRFPVDELEFETSFYRGPHQV